MSGTLFILVEGNDDERFFDRVVRPIAEGRYCWVKPWKYSQQPNRRTKSLVRSARAMQADFIYVRDLDGATCVSAKKTEIHRELRSLIPPENIIVVAEEIESWYLAGVDEATCEGLGMGGLGTNTDTVTKEAFERLRPQTVPRIDLMEQLLADFDVNTAMARNRSFCYFAGKWLDRRLGD